MARKSGNGSGKWIWLALFLALSAGMAVSTWQADIRTLREQNWALKTTVADSSPSVVRPARASKSLAHVLDRSKAAPFVEEEAPGAEIEPLLPPIAGPANDDEAPAIAESAPQVEPAPVAVKPEVVVDDPIQEPAQEPVQEPVVEERVVVTPEQSTEKTVETPPTAQIAAAPERRESEADDKPIAPAEKVALPKLESDAELASDKLPRAEALFAELEALEDSPVFSQFARAAAHELELFAAHSSLNTQAAQNSLKRLELIRKRGLDLAEVHRTDALLTTHLRAVHGLSRRLLIWPAIAAAENAESSVSLSSTALTQIASQTRQTLRKSHEASAANWEKFLLLDEFTKSSRAAVLSDRDLLLLRRFANRVHGENLSDDQKRFLQYGPARELVEMVDLYLAAPLSTHKLLEVLEAYEAEPTSAGAAAIAGAIRQASLMQGREYTELAERLSAFYRAANMRIAIAESLINELIPAPQDSLEAVNDHLMGAQVTGRSAVSTRLRVNLVPDPTRWRVGLEAAGNVASNTQAFRGPFTFFNQGWANYRARTTVGLGKQGFDMSEPTAEASSQTDLLDLQSDFDGIPVFGTLARSVARQQHANKQMEAEWEVEGRMARRIEQKLDSELNTRIRQAEKEWSSRVAQPLEDLHLNPRPIALETTSERLIARYRVAGNSQLAAHTPRPLAPSDSVLSVQLHVSAVNNFIEQLGLSGKTYKLEDLYLHLSKAMGATDLAIPDEMPAGVSVRFADQEALRMDIRNGEAELTVRLAEIRQGKMKWKNVQVRGRFTPKVNGLHAELERTSYIELKGDGLKKIGGGQVILRMAFSSVLSRVSNVPLIHPKLTEHPKMQGYAFRQFTLEDGWIGLAIGPKLATASNEKQDEHAETAHRPKSPMLDRILRR